VAGAWVEEHVRPMGCWDRRAVHMRQRGCQYPRGVHKKGATAVVDARKLNTDVGEVLCVEEMWLDN
jgi:hypothetical protein